MGKSSTSYKPGETGNKKGRPPGKSNKKLLIRKLTEALNIYLPTIKGGQINAGDAIVKKIISEAVSGKRWATEIIFKYLVGLPIPRDRALGFEDLPVKLIFGEDDENL